MLPDGDAAQGTVPGSYCRNCPCNTSSLDPVAAPEDECSSAGLGLQGLLELLAEPRTRVNALLPAGYEFSLSVLPSKGTVGGGEQTVQHQG